MTPSPRFVTWRSLARRRYGWVHGPQPQVWSPLEPPPPPWLGASMKELIAALRGESDTVECARCGVTVPLEQAEPEEGGEWECTPCNIRCNEQERRENERR